MGDFIKSAGMFHVAFGVRDLDKSVKFYMETLEITEILEEFHLTFNPMPDTFHNSFHLIEGKMIFHKTGGLTLEPIIKRCPTPRAIFAEPRLGDIGPNKVTFAVSDVETFFQQYQEKVRFIGNPQFTTLPGLGDYAFVYGKDPDGNILEFASWEGAKVEEGLLGGARILGVGVTDLARSKAFYQEHCDMDIVVSEHDKFSGLVGGVSGSPDMHIKSCLLDCSRSDQSPVGTAMFELYEVSNPRGRSIPFGTEWGDYGFMELSTVAIGNKYELALYYENHGIEVVQRPTTVSVDNDENMENWFMYARDPDGNFVETVGFNPLG